MVDFHSQQAQVSNQSLAAAPPPPPSPSPSPPSPSPLLSTPAVLCPQSKSSPAEYRVFSNCRKWTFKYIHILAFYPFLCILFTPFPTPQKNKTKLDLLVQKELASRLTLNMATGYVEPQHIAAQDIKVMIMSVLDQTAITNSVLDEMYVFNLYVVSFASLLSVLIVLFVTCAFVFVYVCTRLYSDA